MGERRCDPRWDEGMGGGERGGNDDFLSLVRARIEKQQSWSVLLCAAVDAL